MLQSAAEVWSGRTGKLNSKLEREYVRVFRAVASTPFDEQVEILLATQGLFGLTIGEPYTANGFFDTGVILKEVSISQEDNPYSWLITASFGSVTDDPQKQDENPLDRPPVIAFSFDKYQRVLEFDLTGRAVVNSAGERFDPPTMRDDSRGKLVITRNEATFDPGIAAAYQDAINSDTFWGQSAGTWKVQSITGTSKYEQELSYAECVFEFHYRPDGWQLILIDSGYHIIDGGQLKVALDPNGNPFSSPALLNGAGALNPVGAAAVQLPPFNVYPSLPFGDLDLPQSFY